MFKLGMYVYLDNHSHEFENGADQIQKKFALNAAALRALPISDGLFFSLLADWLM